MVASAEALNRWVGNLSQRIVLSISLIVSPAFGGSSLVVKEQVSYCLLTGGGSYVLGTYTSTFYVIIKLWSKLTPSNRLSII